MASADYGLAVAPADADGAGTKGASGGVMIGGGVAVGGPNASGSCGGAAGVPVAAGCSDDPSVAGGCVGAVGLAEVFSGASNGTV
jgi:hypothetical protein